MDLTSISKLISLSQFFSVLDRIDMRYIAKIVDLRKTSSILRELADEIDQLDQQMSDIEE